MARARIKIPLATQRLVYARSGGYCANPSCRRDLFPEFVPGRFTTVAKLAHIIGSSKRGPRGAAPVSVKARNDGANVILLCSNCHEQVDTMNATDYFTVELLTEWKQTHEERVRRGAGIPRFTTRAKLNEAVAPLLRENYGVWRNLGPEGPAGEDPMGAGVEVWRQAVIEKIIPNNRRALEFIDSNVHLLTREELEVVEDFRVHAGAMDLNYSSGKWRAGTPRYPAAFSGLFGV